MRRSSRAPAPFWCAALATLAPFAVLAQHGVAAPASAGCAQDESVYPPWQPRTSDDASDRGLEFTVPDADNFADFLTIPAYERMP